MCNPVNVSIAVPAPVVRKMDNAVYWINLYSVNDAIVFPNTIRWKVMYLVDSAIQRF